MLSWIGVVGALLAAVLVVSLISYFLVRHYNDPRDSSKLTTACSVLALVVTLFCVLIIPVDIYTVSSSLNADGSQAHPDLVHDSSQFVKYLYTSFYIALVALAFFILPFAYFYFEEDGEDVPTSARVWSGLKYMAGFVLFFGIILTLGLVLKTNKGDPNVPWKTKLSDSFSSGDAVLAFAINTLAVIGLTGWVMYTAWGFSYLPISLMRFRSSSSAAREEPLLPDRSSANRARGQRGAKSLLELDAAITKSSENANYLQSKYDMSGKTWTSSDRAELGRLRAEERKLRRERDELATKQRSSISLGGGSDGRCARIWNAFAPLRIAVGIPLFLLSLLIVVSMLLSSIDKFKHSDCGASCGYALSRSGIINPLDEFLKICSKAFPMDFLLFGGLVVWVFVATVAGVVGLGVRILLLKMYTFRKQRTAPHAMVMACWLLMFVVLCLNMQMLVLSPQYATYGNQFYMAENNSTGVMEKHECALEVDGLTPPNTCVMTQIATFINTNNLQLPFFGVILFYANLGFMFFYFVFMLVAVCKSRERFANYGELRDEDWD